MKPHLESLPGLKSWSADVDSTQKTLTVEGDESVLAQVPERVSAAGYAVLKELPTSLSLGMVSEAVTPVAPALPEPGAKTYLPLILILGYLLLGVAALEVAAGHWQPMRAMRNFMAGFFLVFSFFKLLNLRAFADAYAGYDIVAHRIYAYGFVYPFIELGLGLAYLADTPITPVNVNLITFFVMAISLVGVLQTVLNKKKIRCACLGTVFNLPMSYVTIIEDGLMLAMSLIMLIAG